MLTASRRNTATATCPHDAAATLARVPFFVRGLVERKTEAYAAAANSRVITAEVLAAAKAHNGR